MAYIHILFLQFFLGTPKNIPTTDISGMTCHFYSLEKEVQDVLKRLDNVVFA